MKVKGERLVRLTGSYIKPEMMNTLIGLGAAHYAFDPRSNDPAITFFNTNGRVIAHYYADRYHTITGTSDGEMDTEAYSRFIHRNVADLT